MSRRHKPRQVSCIVEGDRVVFIVSVKPNRVIHDLKDVIRKECVSSRGTALFSKDLTLWKVCATSNTACVWLTHRGFCLTAQ